MGGPGGIRQRPLAAAVLLVGCLLVVMRWSSFDYFCSSMRCIKWTEVPLVRRIPQPVLPAPLRSTAIEACSRQTREGKRGVVLTFYNNHQSDGAGAQLQRILGIYTLSVSLGLGYVHTPLRSVDNQGIVSRVENKYDERIVDQWRSAFVLPEHHTLGCQAGNDPFPDDGCHHVRVTSTFDIYHLARFMHTNCFNRTVLHLAFAHHILDHKPEFGFHPDLSWRRLLPWLDHRLRASATREVRVAIHVRRGDLFLIQSHRMLPNQYYICVANMVARALRTLDVPYVFEIYTESVTASVNVTVTQNQTPVLLSPDDSKLWEFDALTPKRLVLNGNPLDTLQAMASADVFITSRSSFSHTAALLHDSDRASLVVFYEYWHTALPTWFALPAARAPFTWLAMYEKAIKDELEKRFAPFAVDSVSAPSSRASRPVSPAPTHPRVIHVVSLDTGHEAEARWRSLSHELRRLNPDYVINHVSNETAHGFIDTHFPWHFDLFESSNQTQWKSDLLRCMLLYVHGGVSMDLGVHLRIAVDELMARFPTATDVYVLRPPDEASTDFVVTLPRNPLFLELLRSAARGGHDQFAKRTRAVFLEHFPCMREFSLCKDAFFLREALHALLDKPGSIVAWTNHSSPAMPTRIKPGR